MRLLFASAALAAALLLSSAAFAQTAFVEGHVFNKRTGVPLSGAVVRVFENVTLRPVPVELASGITDDNGFYQFEVEKFLGAPARIEVVCATPWGEVHGRSSARLREGLVRRDVYLGRWWYLTRCQPMELLE